MILSTDQKIKLKQLFENKKFSEIEYFVESLGDIKKNQIPKNAKYEKWFTHSFYTYRKLK